MHIMTRRELILGSLTAASLSGKSKIDRSRISAITDEIAKTPQEAIDFAHQYRLQFVELRNVPGGKEYAFLPEADVKLAATQFAQAGLKVSFLNSSLLKYPWPDAEPVGLTRTQRSEKADTSAARIKTGAERFARRMEELRTAINNCHILGVDLLRVFTGTRTAEPEKLVPRIVDVLGEMSLVAEKEKIHLLIENEYSCNIGTSAELANILKKLPSKWIGANWDSMNGLELNEKPFPDGYDVLPKSRIGNVQIKGKQLLDYPEKLDWKPIFQRLEKDGYQGKIGLETHIPGPGLIEASHASMREIIRIVEDL